MIPDRTHFPTRAQLDRILQGARSANELGRVYWYVEAKLPGRMTTSGKPEIQAASFPGRCVPLVPVAPDPAESRHWADLLLELFKASNKGVDFGLSLTDVDHAAGFETYEWGAVVWDCVCVVCGGVFGDTSPNRKLCEACEKGEKHGDHH